MLSVCSFQFFYEPKTTLRKIFGVKLTPSDSQGFLALNSEINHACPTQETIMSKEGNWTQVGHMQASILPHFTTAPEL